MPHDPDFVALCDDAKTRIREIGLDELLSAQDEGRAPMLIDVREDREWQAGGMPGAVHIGRGVFERDLASRASHKGQSIVVYCGGGFRSALAADAALLMGYTDVRSLAGGIKAWWRHLDR